MDGLDKLRKVQLERKRRLAQELVHGWNNDTKMWVVIDRALCDDFAHDEEGRKKMMQEATAYLRAYIPFNTTARVWIAMHWKGLNDFLWAGRPNAVCVRAALSFMGVRRKHTYPEQPSLRERDKTHDWKTVK